MPELPEVETVRKTLLSVVLHKEIKSVHIYYDPIISGDTHTFVSTVRGQTIQDIDRIGKYLIFKLDRDAFISHLRMEGKYKMASPKTPMDRHEHVAFTFSDGSQMRYHDTRKFGRLALTSLSSYATLEPFTRVGPEPWQAQVLPIYKRLHRSSLPIKTLLLDQSIIAGIGNIYANEICFDMRINPYTPGHKVSPKRVGELLEVACRILDQAIQQGGTTIHSFDANGITGLFQVQLQVHMQSICPVCKGNITKEKIHGRGTYYCKKCQRQKR